MEDHPDPRTLLKETGGKERKKNESEIIKSLKHVTFTKK